MQANDADRAAAASLAARWGGDGRAMLAGEVDENAIVQAFAAHRIQSARNARAEALGAMEDAVRNLHGDEQMDAWTLEALSGAIEALKGAE